jgi:hypothetical protein
MAKKISKKLQTASDKINRGREVTRQDDKVRNPKIGLLDIDSTIFYYFENVIKPIVEEAGEQVKVPVIYANPERWAAIQRQGHIRDNKRKIMTPIITFRRTNLTKDESIPVDKLDPTSPKLVTTYQSRYTQENRYDKLSVTKGISPKREMFNVAVPDYVVLNYDFIIWTSFTDQMNSIVEKINWSEGSYWGEPGKFRFRCTIDSFEDASEYEGNKRSIKTNFSVTLRGYLVPDSFNDLILTQKFITPKQIIISDETDINILPITHIDDEGAKSIRVVTNLGSGGGGSINSTLTLAPGDNMSFTAFAYNGYGAISSVLATSLDPLFTTVTASQGMRTDQLYVADDSHIGTNINVVGTGSFGRLETGAISGTSPLQVDGGLNLSGDMAMTGSLAVLGNFIVDGQTTLTQVDIDEKALVVSGAFAIANAVIGAQTQKARAEIESLGILGNRTDDLAPVLDLGDGFQ